MRVMRWLSAHGILVGTPETAACPALVAATAPDSTGGACYGPSGPGGLGGAPAQQPLFPTLRSAVDAARVWEVSERLTRTEVAAA